MLQHNVACLMTTGGRFASMGTLDVSFNPARGRGSKLAITYSIWLQL